MQTAKEKSIVQDGWKWKADHSLNIQFQHVFKPGLLFCFICFVCFSNPTWPPRSQIASIPCVPFYTLSYPAFKGVARGISYVSLFQTHSNCRTLNYANR